ncbi:hypothetical protein O7598_10435 [Micromonospora sp. WMMC241]|uniref:ankyrin repeat domain-containing protein n=1 Tax=Micromonospora sp. WMMC241 TaxID=3015159 RepID=UPI0022B6A5E5|nr:ankyrin repeat domain-containing protein [Micromonospora sp. WMMC241]MCZ7436809.1 hypothetical protein [Micromonospora sp. WMMC241]
MGDRSEVRLSDGGDVGQVRAWLAAGADPAAPGGPSGRTMLHEAARYAAPEVLAVMCEATRDLDTLAEGRSALWVAVHAGRTDNARVLAAAGADPWLPMMSGWSPGRLGLAGPEPELFPDRPAGVALTPEEAATAAAAPALRAALDGFDLDGAGLLCVAGVDAVEAVRRLDGAAVTEENLLAYYDVEVDDESDEDDEDAWRWLEDIRDPLLVGVTDVPGGCVLTQPWGYQPQTPVVGRALSAGTVAYGVYANPKSGNQGSVFVDGRAVSGDLHPGGDPWADASGGEILLAHLYRGNPAAYACAFVGLRPADARPVTGPPDTWLLLPDRDHRQR